MIRFRLSFGWVLVALALPMLAQAMADEPKPAPADPVVALIDKLVELDTQDTGYSGADSGGSFLPLGRSEASGRLISPRQGKFGSSDAMKSLVKLGMKAVPALLERLSDDRKTKIVIEHEGFFGGMSVHHDEGDDPTEKFGDAGSRYTVRVGDLCYVALGQIVNREYSAVQYIPTAFVSITCMPRTKKLRAEMVKEWGKLTADSHRDSLVKDFKTREYRVSRAAAVRLGYYYPETFEPLVVKELTSAASDTEATDEFIQKQLYPAKTAKERKALLDEFSKKHGDFARDDIIWLLFLELPKLTDDDRIPKRKNGDEAKARECLAQVFGYTDKVTRKDRPANEPLGVETQAYLAGALQFDRSEKIDKAVRDLLAKSDDEYLGKLLMDRLVGRGYDTDLEAYIKRRLPKVEAKERDYWKKSNEAKLGWTWLHKAVDVDVPDLIEAALKDKPDVNAKAKDGRTALHLAAAEGRLGSVELLLKAKADPLVKDGTGKLPVQLAAFADDSDVVRRLVAAKSGVPDVLVAAIVGDADRLAELLKADPTLVKARTEYGFTPLHVAAREGHEKAVGVLFAAKADVNTVDLQDGEKESWQGFTPLHLAAMAGKAGVAKLLLNKGAEVSTADKGKFTPLHYAAGGGFADVVKLLLDYKADRELRANDGRTPLEEAKRMKHAAVVKLLEAK